jgi:ribosomal protein L7/L12
MNELERKLDFVLSTLNLEYQDSGGSQEYPQVEALVAQGRKLEAIQAYQLATGANLSDARQAVESMAKRPGK